MGGRGFTHPQTFQMLVAAFHGAATPPWSDCGCFEWKRDDNPSDTEQLARIPFTPPPLPTAGNG